MANRHHRAILERIKKNSGKPTKHTFQNSYLGTDRPRYPIGIPALRAVAKSWMKENPGLTGKDIAGLITALTEGKSSTEKTMGGLLLDYTTADQRTFDPEIFEHWIEQLSGWAEVDALCSGKYTISEIPAHPKVWKKLLLKFAKSRNIHLRRASLVLLVAPMRNTQLEELAAVAFRNILILKNEKEILITKAISWLLRSMIKKHRGMIIDFMAEHAGELPAIAVRETRIKLATGRKTPRKAVR